ncbi:MAG TPA: 2'-deoxycytidine 5'-triphosphate deaminase [Gemmatimonadaceae bacterium]|nr:2'-deoxycytidine 5'-triphosphate deaminase [Gemmatimonadaceae bacterium]
MVDQHSLFPRPADAREEGTGILASQHIKDLIQRQAIAASAPIDAGQVQPASLDLRLGPTAYRVHASFLPGRTRRVMNRVEDLLIETIDLSSDAVLHRGFVYIVPLMEQLALSSDYSAKANPKSTTGRLDIFTRLIADYADSFDVVPAGYKGQLFVEVVPKTFDIRLKQGARLNQLRVRRGDPRPADTVVQRLHNEQGLVFVDGEKVRADIEGGGVWVHLDLRARENGVVGYKAKNQTAIIDLEKIGHYDVDEFWEVARLTRQGALILRPDEFYILVSRESVKVPLSVAADMVPYDPAVGEYRVHYAGFFDPGFGATGAGVGTPAVLEVRSHEVPFVLEDGQPVARLIYEQLLASPSKVYGVDIGSSYQRQGLTLAKQFRRE